PITTGDYTFWIASDDESELHLSTNLNPANAVVIANIGESCWTNPREWTKYASQQSEPIRLVGGEKYYISAIMKQGIGGDNLAVAWSGPDTGGEVEVIRGCQLSPIVKLWAYDPMPRNDEEAAYPNLTWQPGKHAAWHHIYFGTDPNALNLVATKPLGDESYDPGPLELDTAYYWRIVEVNDAHPNSPWPGPVWSFFRSPGRVITNVIRSNGVSGDRDPIGEYDANTPPLETQKGGLKDGNIVYSDRTYSWTSTPPELTGAEYIRTFNSDKGSEDVTYDVTFCAPVTVLLTVDDRIAAQQDVVDNIVSDFASAGTFTDTGLDLFIQETSSDRSASVFSAELPAGTYTFGAQRTSYNFYIIGAIVRPMTEASDPRPQDGAIVIDANLTWQPGDYAAWHQVYFGTDPNALDLVDTMPLGDESYDPGPLALDTAYYWRIVEVNEAHPYSPCLGPVWRFTTIGPRGDCNGNGIPDIYDIADGNSLDCNGNGIPDECDIADGNSLDCNGNGVPDECDIVIQNLEFDAPADYLTYGSGRGVASGDIDGDGDSDLVVLVTGGFSALLNNGDGSFVRSAEHVSIEGGINGISLADFDDDNDLDIAIVNAYETDNQPDPPEFNGNLKVFLNSGDATFELFYQSGLNYGSQSIVSGDLDSDGDLDLVVSHQYFDPGGPGDMSSEISLFLNNGNAVFTRKQGVPDCECSVYGMSIADFDNDDDLDLAVAAGPYWEDDFEGIVIYENTGMADFAATQSYSLTGLAGMLVADFDLDGFSDLVVSGTKSGSVSIKLNNHDGTFGGTKDYSCGYDPTAMNVGDVDGDGDFDLILGSWHTNTVGIMRNNGQGEFADPTSFSTDGEHPGGILSADLDDNGLLDIVAVIPDLWNVSVFLNRSVSMSQDCDGNGIPDECDIADDPNLDCNGNGIPDECDIAKGASTDENEDGVPDECQFDVRVVPVAVLIDPASTTEVRTTLPDSIEAVVRGGKYYLEIWASDTGAVKTGLTGVYLDISFCGQTSASSLEHGTIFTTFTAGNIQPGGIDEFGGSTFSPGVGIEPNWVRVGWVEMSADVDVATCSVSLLPSVGGVAAYGQGLVPWSFISLDSIELEILPPARSYDLDGVPPIGVGDFSLFVPSWQQTVPPAQNAHDFDCDCFVGVGDLSWFATGWMKSPDDPTILYPPCPGGGNCGEMAPLLTNAAGGFTLASLRPVTRMSSPPADTDVAFELVVLNSPSVSDTTVDLPTSIGTITQGQTYYVELWTGDIGDISTGITSAYVDLHFPAGAASVTNISHGSLFTLLPSGSVTSGVINELGGSQFSGSVGVAPQWARVAVIRMRADAAPPSVGFSLSPSSTGVAAWGRGQIDWDDIYLGGASVPPIITGYVRTSHGRGVGGVLVSADNGGGSGLTDPAGYYEVVVPQGWSGTLAPYSDFSLSFDPGALGYGNVMNIHSNQDYVAQNICDLDGNDNVTMADFAYFADYWLQSGAELPANFDSSDTVGFPDLDIFLKNWLWTP
ncbi:MAG: VCBS repeat-containing protein, partial [Sedimentisphaerales bacterium]|nr:VCBS repeat-containing protein [Sedimentisphaerales bacterium]